MVDDNADNRAVLTRRLNRLGYSAISQAADGQEALDALTALPFDAVLLDVMMPVVSGIEVLQTLRAQGRLEASPVIMISAATDIDIVVRCLELGAEDYLPKPFNPALLKARLGSVLEKAALRREVRRQLARLEAELAEARRQQLSMVPQVFPRGAGPIGASLHGVMLPAREVGGDLYDVFELGADRLCFAVADISDKGVPAALFMARTRSVLRGAALQLLRTEAPPSPSGIVGVVNDELCRDNPACMFATLFIAILDLRTGLLTYTNAGHLPPFLLRVGSSPERLAEGPAEPPVGVLSPYRHRDASVRLDPGDGLVMFTDGLPDTLNPEGREYAIASVVSDLDGLLETSPEAMTAHLLARSTAFAAGAAQADDIAVLALRLSATR